MSALVVDRAAIETFVNALLKYADPGGYVSLRAFVDVKGADETWGNWPVVQINGAGLAPVINAAVAFAQACANADKPVVFCPPIATFTGARKAREEDVANGLVLSVDIDTAPAAARGKLEGVLGPATIVTASGGEWANPQTGEVEPKLHMDWRLSEATRDKDDHARLKQARQLATTLAGADGSAVPLVHPLRWPGSWHRKATPRLARIITLNEAAEIHLDDALQRLQEAVEATGADPRSADPSTHQSGEPQADFFDIAAALEAIPNNNFEWKVWNDRVGLATWAATGGSEAGFAAFDAWSRKSAKYDATETRARWNHIAKYPPNRIGAGTLFHLAAEARPGWRKPSSEFVAPPTGDPYTDYGNGHPPGGASVPGKEDEGEDFNAAPPGPSPLPLIRITAGERHVAADQGIAALHGAGVAFYQRDKSLVRVCRVKARATTGEVIMVPGIAAVTPALLDRALGQSARWERFDARKKGFVRTDPPGPVANQILDMFGEWPFPPITGVIGCPTLRPDGSLLATEGYDLATGLVLESAVPIPRLSEFPSRDEAVDALALLDSLLGEFPFKNEASRSVALSMLLTPVLRGAMPTSPMHLTVAPEAGTGKSYLADVSSMIATGEKIAVVAIAPNPEETEKRLIGAALQGYPMIGLDNCHDTLTGDFLCQVTERPLLQLRALGRSDKIRIANTFTVFANGNNTDVADDMVRRTIRCDLDADVEDPECREFQSDPIAAVRRNRGAYIAAAITVARGYIAAGKPNRPKPLLSYEAWSDIVRGPLVWLGKHDPVDTMRAARAADPVRQERSRLFTSWLAELGTEIYLTADIIDRVEDRLQDGKLCRPQLHALLLETCAKRGNASQIDRLRVSKLLRQHENTIAGGIKLIIDRSDKQRPRYGIRCTP